MENLKQEYGLRGSPRLGLWMATLGLFAGLTTIVFYGVAGPEFKETLGLSGLMLGLLLSSPHLSKAILRVPFGAWVDEVGGRKPFLILLGMSNLGMLGLVLCLWRYHPLQFDRSLFPLLLLVGILGGAGAATFSVGVPQTSYWYPVREQGLALGIYGGLGNIGPGLFNLLMPLLVGLWGLTMAYASWLGFLLVSTGIYAFFAADAYYFQLLQKGVGPQEAQSLARSLGQEIFPSGNTWDSVRRSGKNSLTWILVLLYSISFGGGFTALTAWFPTYWYSFHHLSLIKAGALAAVFTTYGSLIRIYGGSLSDKYGGERVASWSFACMALGGAILTFSQDLIPAFLGMMVLGSGMGVANAAVFKLVPKYVPDAVGGASGWIGGVGGAGTLLILPLLGFIVDHLGEQGYARGFAVYLILSLACSALCYGLQRRAALNEQSV